MKRRKERRKMKSREGGRKKLREERKNEKCGVV